MNLLKRRIKLRTNLKREEVNFILSKIIESDLYQSKIGYFDGHLEDDQFKMYKITPVGQLNSFNPVVVGKIRQKENIVLIHVSFSFNRGLIFAISFLIIFTTGWTLTSKGQDKFDNIEPILWALAFILFAFYRFRLESKRIERLFLELFEAEIV